MTVTIATLNLHHFAEPGVGWMSPRRSHTEESFRAKCAWLREFLREIDADVIGLQEVASPAALRDLLAEVGYETVAIAEEPEIDPPKSPGAPPVYRRAVNALAARAPMRWSSVTPRAGLAPALGLKEGRGFRKAVLRGVVETPAIGPIVVYCAHFKSHAVSVGDSVIAGEPTPEALSAGALSSRARAGLEALSRSHAGAVIQRVYEATALLHDAVTHIAADPTRPVVALGDFNDGPESPTLRALTPYRAFIDGETGADAAAAWRLVDAARLAPPALLSDARPATNHSRYGALTLDYVLISSALCPDLGGGRAQARVSRYAVHDAHLRAASPERASDHAAVAITLTPLAPEAPKTRGLAAAAPPAPASQ